MRTYMWNDSLALGVPAVDDHHKKILNALRELQLQLYNQVSDEEITEKLMQINEYRVEHFRDEEKLMEPYAEQLSCYKAHVAAHKEFADNIDDFLLKYSLEGPKIAGELYEYLGHWLHVHIGGLDKKTFEELTTIDSAFFNK